MFYVATSHKGSNVSHAITANFTGPSDRNLIVAKTNRIEVYEYEDGTLRPLYESPVNGRIASLQTIRVPVSSAPKVQLAGAFSLLLRPDPPSPRILPFCREKTRTRSSFRPTGASLRPLRLIRLRQVPPRARTAFAPWPMETWPTGSAGLWADPSCAQ